MARGRRPPTGRDVARRVLHRVETSGAYASLALGGELSRAELPVRDRRLATEIVYGVLRHRGRLDRAVDALARRAVAEQSAAIRAVLRAGAYQILLLDRVPAHAAVDDAVSAARRRGGAGVAGFVNGVLRRLAREGEPPLPDPGSDPRGYATASCSLPAWIARRLEAAVGEGELAPAAGAMLGPAPLALRANTLRASAGEVEDALAGEGASARAVPLAPAALEAEGIGDPDASPSFRRGLWTVQDVAAQLVGHLVAPPADAGRILDACAGVGGKSTHLAQLSGDGVAIDAADRSGRKLELLASASERLGVRSVRPVRADLTDPAGALADRYDAALVDAPCTGLGVIRRHPETKWRVGEEQVAAMAALQTELLDAVAARVAPGGVLVYSVCTFTDEEGPSQVRRFLDRHRDFGLEPPPEGAGAPPWRELACDGTLATWPHRHGTDAFFAARLRRAG